MDRVVAEKPVVLGLVHLKRLDVGKDAGAKVYKVK